MNNENIILISIIVLVLILFGVYIFVTNQNKNENKNKKRDKKGGCKGTRWGCCPDGNIPAKGKNFKGC